MAGSGDVMTYGELDQRSNQVAHFLRGNGICAGDTIAVVLDNDAWMFPLVWGAQRAGVYFTCLSYRLSGKDLAYILSDCGAKLTFGAKATRSVLEAAKQAGFSGPVELLNAAWSGQTTLADRLKEYPIVRIMDEMAGSDMLYSSGTTGLPKGVRQPFVADRPIDTPTPLLSLSQKRFGMGPDTVYLCPAPLYHAGPLRWSMLVHRLGGTVVVMEKFDAEAALQAIARYHVNVAQFVPTHFSRFLRLPEAVRTHSDLSSLRIALHAAAPCPVPLKRAMLDWWGPIIHEYYGGTENNGLTMIGPDEWLSHPGSVGKAYVGELKICDDNGEVLPAGETGDVYFAGGSQFEYHNDPDKTQRAYNKHGWSTLGDIGHVDADGYLYLTDRRNFTIISGGVNIYPQEIENALCGHPAVADAAVIGAPDADFGERVVAVVELMDAAEAGPDMAADIRDFARAKLGSLKAPKLIDFRDSLPREPTGKLFKKLLVEEYRKRVPTEGKEQ